MAQKFTNGVMDERIVRLNEFKGVKMAQLSKGKRPAAKFNKEVANYLLDNWDDVEALKTCLDAMHKDMPEGCEEVMEIYDKRVKELLDREDREKAKRKRIQDEKRAKHEAEAAANELTNKSKTGASKIRKVGDHHPTQPWVWTEYKKGKFDWRTDPALKRKPGGKPGASKIRKVGDRHPNNLWVWTEYKPGKFDWRTDPALKQKPGRKAGATNNQSKKKEVAGKAGKAEPAAAPKLTLTELLAKPTPKGLSKPQQSVIKSLKKGFRLRKDGNALWLTDAAGNNERTEKGVLEALQRRYKIDYIPDDIWYNG